MMTVDLRKLKMNKSKSEKESDFLHISGMHNRTQGDPLSNIKPLESEDMILSLQVVIGIRGAQQ